MNFDKLTDFAIATVLTAALFGNLPRFQKWVWQAEAQVLYASRTSIWGSPNYLKNYKLTVKPNKTTNQAKGGLNYAQTSNQN
jgi:hypothetical protein